MNKVLLYGGTGQSKVIKSILESNGYVVDSIIDDTEGLSKPFEVQNFIVGQNSYERWKKNLNTDEYNFVITIGNPNGQVRKKLYDKLISDGLIPLNPIHKNTQIESILGNHIQIHSGVVIEPFTKIGDYCIINTGAVLTHDCVLGDAVELGPNSTICGEVRIGDYSWIGANSTILPRVNIGSNSIVGAGSVVTKDIPSNEVWVGNPAKFLKKNNI